MTETVWHLPDAVLVGDGSEPLAGAAVGVREGRITEVRSADSLSAGELSHSRTHPGLTMAPGFIDAHVHLLFSCDADHERTRSTFTTAPASRLAARGARNLLECLLGGITTVRDLGDTKWVVRDLRDAVSAGTLVGPRVLTAGAPVTTPSGHLNWCGNVAESEDDLTAAVNRVLDGGADVVKIMSTGGNMTRESNPLRPQFTAAALASAVELAHARGIRVAAHSQTARAIRDCIAAGIDTIEHCLWREDDGSPADPTGLVDALQGARSTVVLTLAGIQRALVPGSVGFTDEDRSAALAISPTGDLSRDFAWARAVYDSGTDVVVASDAGVRFTPFRGFLDTLRAAQVALQFTPSEAVHAATGAAAKALGVEREVGTLAPGMRADLVLLDSADAEHELGGVVEVLMNGETVVTGDHVVLPHPPLP